MLLQLKYVADGKTSRISTEMLEEQIRDLVPCDVEPEEEKDEEF